MKIFYFHLERLFKTWVNHVSVYFLYINSLQKHFADDYLLISVSHKLSPCQKSFTIFQTNTGWDFPTFATSLCHRTYILIMQITDYNEKGLSHILLHFNADVI